MGKQISGRYRHMYDIIWRMMLENDKTSRIAYGDMAIHEIEKLQEHTLHNDVVIDSFSRKLTNASMEIMKLKNWQDCIYEALGNKIEEYLYSAKIIQDIKSYKRKD